MRQQQQQLSTLGKAEASFLLFLFRIASRIHCELAAIRKILCCSSRMTRMRWGGVYLVFGGVVKRGWLGGTWRNAIIYANLVLFSETHCQLLEQLSVFLAE